MADEHRIPQKIGDFNTYLNDTTDYLSTNNNWSRLGLTGTELADWQNFKTAWNLLYPTYFNKGTRTPNITKDLKKIRKDFNTFAIPLLNRMATSSNINTLDRSTLRLPERDTVPTPRGKIDEVPFVEFISKPGGRIQVRSRVTEDASRSSMPPLADAVEIKYLIGTTAPANPTAAVNSVVSKKALFFIETDGTKAGQRFFGFARYVNLSNPANNGSFGTIVSVIIQG